MRPERAAKRAFPLPSCQRDRMGGQAARGSEGTKGPCHLRRRSDHGSRHWSAGRADRRRDTSRESRPGQVLCGACGGRSQPASRFVRVLMAGVSRGGARRPVSVCWARRLVLCGRPGGFGRGSLKRYASIRASCCAFSRWIQYVPMPIARTIATMRTTVSTEFTSGRLLAAGGQWVPLGSRRGTCRRRLRSPSRLPGAGCRGCRVRLRLRWPQGLRQ